MFVAMIILRIFLGVGRKTFSCSLFGKDPYMGNTIGFTTVKVYYCHENKELTFEYINTYNYKFNVY